MNLFQRLFKKEPLRYLIKVATDPQDLGKIVNELALKGWSVVSHSQNVHAGFTVILKK